MIGRATLATGLLAATFALGLLPAFGQVSFDFMPDGGRGLLARLVGDRSSVLTEIAGARRDLVGWQDYLAGQGDLSDTERSTLAGYLSVNFPLPEGELQAGDDLFAALPPDGKDLAIGNCQTCHSIFSGYLMQDRDSQGWRSIFLSPFHRELAMTEQERATFVLYSAANMPLEFEAVPPELRF